MMAGHFVIGGVELILKAHYDKIDSLTEPS